MGIPESILAAFILTYLLHSSVLLAAAWLSSRLLGERRRTREILWRAAVLGSLVTAGLQVGIGFEPVAGRLELPGSSFPAREADRRTAAQRETPPPSLGGEALRAVPRRPPAGPDPAGAPAAASTLPLAPGIPRETPPDGPPAHAAPLASGVVAAPGRLAHVPGSLDSMRRRASERLAAALAPLQDRLLPASLLRAATLLLLGVAGLGLLRIARGWLVLRRGLSARREVLEGPLAEVWFELLRRARPTRAPRLFLCPGLGTPLTTGLWRPRICVPARAAVELRPAAQRALLAHELAHAQRRDPLWSLVLAIVAALLWVQPLNRVARRELEALAELSCDDRALELGTRPIELARCLTHVAGWVVAQPRGLPASGMATQRALLGSRVRRLIDERCGAAPEPQRRLALLCAAGALAGVCAAAPAVVASSPVQMEPARLVAPGEHPLESPSESPLESSILRERSKAPATQREELDAERVAGDALGLPELLATLDRELECLAGDLGALRARAGALPEAGSLTARIERFERRLESLRAQRARLAELLPLALAQHGPRIPRVEPRPDPVLPTLSHIAPVGGQETR